MVVLPLLFTLSSLSGTIPPVVLFGLALTITERGDTTNLFDTTASVTTATTTDTLATHIQTTNHNVVPSATITTTTTMPLLNHNNHEILPAPPTGTIADISDTCPIEDIEHVNTVQLYEILQNLKHLSTVRNIMIDIQPNKCIFSPLQPTTSSSSKKGDNKTGKSNAFATTASNLFSSSPETDDSSQCSGGNVGEELDDDAEPLCTVQGGGGGDSGNTDASTTSSTSSKSAKLSKQNPFPKKSSKSSSPIQSNVLQKLQTTGFTSQSQQDTFTWRDMTDTVFTEVSPTGNTTTTNDYGNGDDHTQANHKKNGNNHEDKLQPDDFWDDMCSALWNGKDRSDTKSSSMINLALNPERNTGYNGTHIWRAIYDENCIVGSTARSSNSSSHPNINSSSDAMGVVVDDMCYEERVLYRLLSGLHSSTTISIAKHYYPPSKKKNRTHWESNPTHFMEHVYYNPEYIRNLHFTYVVLLRALSKASTFLYQYDFNVANTDDPLLHSEEDIVMTQKLVRRLLDSSILQSCQSVFSAFDESLMFQEENFTSSSNTSLSSASIFPTFLSNHTSSANNDNQKVDVALLRQNFKGIFHNVSSILDCVQCQQCKLHGKLVMLGYGAALKILLNQNSVPELEYNEIIALINTVIKFSEAIKDVRELTTMYILQQQQLQRKEKFDRDLNNSTVIVVPKKVNDPIVITKPITSTGTTSDSETDLGLVDLAMNVVAMLGRTHRITIGR